MIFNDKDWRKSMLKRRLISYSFIFILALFLIGCHKDQKQTLFQNNNNHLAMPFGSYTADEPFAYEDVEEFVLEEDTLHNPLDPSMMQRTSLAYNQPESLEEFTLEQLDDHDEAHTVYFAYDAHQPTSDQQKTLQRTAKAARELYKQGKTVCCKGHACQWHGTDAYNIALSYNRAYTVAEYLNQEALIPKQNIKIYGVGNTEPIAFENSLEGQAPNRRVEVYGLAA